MEKQAGLSAKQREDIAAALLEYGAHLTEDDHIAKGGKVLSVRLEVKGGRLSVEGGGKLLASYPVSRAGKGISDFVKAFWFWKKAPTEELRAEGPQIEHSTKKSPAQLQREINEVLARPVNGDIVDSPPAAGWTKFHKRAHGYPISFNETSHGQYTMFHRPSDFLVKYAAAIGNIGKIAPVEKIGVYPTLDEALSSVADHDRMRR
jgi:hypothetical protein